MLEIRQDPSWKDYREAWLNGMKHLHWFSENRLFDYDPEEELEDLEKNFCKKDNLFLAAKQGSQILGTLRVKQGYWRDGNAGIFRGWEPAVPAETQTESVGEALIEEALHRLAHWDIKKAVYLLKYPLGSLETASRQIDLYKKCGFGQETPTSVSLLADLSLSHGISAPVRDFRTVGWHNCAFEELADLVLRAFTENAEDRAIHSWDRTVSDREEALKVLRSIREGKFGRSPSECCMVALVGDEPAGIVGSFMPEWKHRPPCGVLGPVGVLPEFRRRGIAYSLLMKTHNILRECGCHYVSVSTPETNTPALRLYEKAGYQTILKQVELVKELNSKGDDDRGRSEKTD